MEGTMKSSLKSLSIAIVFLFSLSVAATGNNPAGPKLVMPTLEHYFGAVKPGTPLEYTFKVRNEGDAPLEIKNVSPACGCTTSEFDKIIQPGQEGKIVLAIKETSKYKGEVIKNATVTTNDPERQSLTLVMRANFVAE
jgi:hypothetical protein